MKCIITVQPFSMGSDMAFGGGGANDDWNAVICGSPGMADVADEGKPASA